MTRRLLVALPSVFGARGGIPRFNQLLCRAIDELAPELGLSGEVIALGDLPEDYESSGASWRHLSYSPRPGNTSALLRSLRVAARDRPTALLVGHLGMTPIGVVCAPFVRHGFGFVVHGTEAWVPPRRSRGFAARRARYVFAVSRFTGETFCRVAGVDPARLRLLPNALAPGFEQIAATASARSCELLSVSRLWSNEHRKGIDRTLEAVARLKDAHPGLTYRIVGRGDDKPRLERMARELGIDQRVFFEQDLPDDDLAARYRECGVFVLPSGQEGFGIVFLEAMRFARPCIGGAAGGTPEVVADGETGLLVPFGDVDALAAAIDRLLSDPKTAQRMGEAGRRRLEEQFTFTRLKERLRGYLQEWLF